MLLNFSDLILLIGTNPLPNYVATKYFIKENSNLKRIWMICSEERQQENQKSTKEYAEALKKILKDNKLEFPNLFFVSDIGSKTSVEEALDILIEQIGNCNVHLSFTGGTKAMSTYSYSYLKSEIKDFSASYLSARSFKIKFDDGTVSENLKDIIKILFDDLLKLHLFENKEEKNDVYENFNNVTNKFQELIEHNKIDNFYSREGGFCRDIFKIDKDKDLTKIFKNMSEFAEAASNESVLEESLGKISNENKKRRAKILKNILNYEPNVEFKSIIDAFPKEYRIYKNGKFNEKIAKDNYKKAVKFMDGFWLERYVGKLIENNLEDKFDEILFNQKPCKTDDEANNFELDIVLMKGYQLIGVSCTTSKIKSICKEKGFEIILRTRQIGGEEAKAVLITRADENKVNSLQSELVLNTGTTQKNILVLGESDWKKQELIKKIEGFCLP